MNSTLSFVLQVSNTREFPSDLGRADGTLRNRVNPVDLGRASEALHTDGTPRTREISADPRVDPELHAPRNREDTADETAGMNHREFCPCELRADVSSGLLAPSTLEFSSSPEREVETLDRVGYPGMSHNSPADPALGSDLRVPSTRELQRWSSQHTPDSSCGLCPEPCSTCPLCLCDQHQSGEGNRYTDNFETCFQKSGSS